MKRTLILFFLCLCMVFGCERAAKESQSLDVETAAANNFKPFVVYTNKGARDNHYIPSGFMGDTQCIQFDDTWQEDCQSDPTCIKVTYDVACSSKGQQWGGVYWQNPANNWGNRKGGYDLTGASKLTFWARGETGNERIEEFKVGGMPGDFPDTDVAMVGPVFLTKEWKQYTIDLRGKDVSYISGGFAWSTNADVNPDNICVFYLDEIRYE